MNTDTTPATYSQITKIKIKTSNDTGSVMSNESREIGGSSFGFICVAETPEDTNCGTTKNLALSAILSIPFDLEIIKKIIEDEKFIQPFDDEYVKLDLDSTVYGWCNGKTVYDFF